MCKLLLWCLSLSIGVRVMPAVTIGQVDTFEDGTTEGWLVGLLGMSSPVPPLNETDGGPGGAGDNFMLLRSIGGEGPGSRLTVLNVAQWSGNYLAAGIQSIDLDLRNLGDTDLTVRLLFERVGPMGPTDIAASGGVFLPAGGDWSRHSIAITPERLTPVLGSVENALSDAGAVRIFHDVAAGLPPQPIVAQLGVDNIAAVVPEPSAMGLVAVALGLVALFRRRLQRD